MNVIRKAMPEQVEALREPLFAAYKALAYYQMEHTPDAEASMRRAIAKAAPLLRPFKKLLPPYKRRFLVALDHASADAERLPASDLLVLFDETVYQMHVRRSPRERGAAKPIEPLGRCPAGAAGRTPRVGGRAGAALAGHGLPRARLRRLRRPWWNRPGVGEALADPAP